MTRKIAEAMDRLLKLRAVIEPALRRLGLTV